MPATIRNSPTYQDQDVNSLVSHLFQTDYPDNTEPISPSDDITLPDDIASFEINNLQPTQTVKHSFPCLPYT